MALKDYDHKYLGQEGLRELIKLIKALLEEKANELQLAIEELGSEADAHFLDVEDAILELKNRLDYFEGEGSEAISIEEVIKNIETGVVNLTNVVGQVARNLGIVDQQVVRLFNRFDDFMPDSESSEAVSIEERFEALVEALAEEVEARENAVKAEHDARALVDGQLSDRINEVHNNLGLEVTARQNADEAINNRLDNFAQTGVKIEEYVEIQRQKRKDEDAAIRQELQNAVETEKNERSLVDGQLADRITALKDEKDGEVHELVAEDARLADLITGIKAVVGPNINYPTDGQPYDSKTIRKWLLDIDARLENFDGVAGESVEEALRRVKADLSRTDNELYQLIMQGQGETSRLDSRVAQVESIVNNHTNSISTLENGKADKSELTNAVNTLNAKDNEQDDRLGAIESKNFAQDDRLTAIENTIGGSGSGESIISRLEELERDPVTKTYVDDQDAALSGRIDDVIRAVGNINSFEYQVVEQLPEGSEIEENVIYLLPDEDDKETGSYIEYLAINGELEPIGTTKADFSDYYTKGEVDGLISDEATQREAITDRLDNIDGIYESSEADDYKLENILNWLKNLAADAHIKIAEETTDRKEADNALESEDEHLQEQIDTLNALIGGESSESESIVDLINGLRDDLNAEVTRSTRADELHEVGINDATSMAAEGISRLNDAMANPEDSEGISLRMEDALEYLNNKINDGASSTSTAISNIQNNMVSKTQVVSTTQDGILLKAEDSNLFLQQGDLIPVMRDGNLIWVQIDIYELEGSRD